MASYQNTSEYYYGITMDSYPEHCSNPSVYFEQNRSNFQVHDKVNSQENYNRQEFYPRQSAPQYPLNQYTPLTTEPVSYPPVFHPEPRPHKNNNCMAKSHRAQITILPTSEGNFKAVVKRKRKRTIFTTEQVEALEEIFKTKQYVSREERQLIVNNLQTNDKAVKIWFQNRRLKIKRIQNQDSEDQDDCSNEDSAEVRKALDMNRLDLVEYEISKNTNEFGFVTLDEGVMANLANFIEDSLSKSNVPVEDIVGNDSSPTYEPVSPANVYDNEMENSICWRPPDPKESLQILFDLKSMPLL